MLHFDQVERPTSTLLFLHDHSTSPPTVVKRWSSKQGPIEIGRAPKAKEKHAQDPTTSYFRSDKTKVMSSKHAKVVWKEGVPHLSDQGSTNGTWLNEKQLQAGDWYKISTGDKIIFGRKVIANKSDGESGDPLELVVEVSTSSPSVSYGSISSSSSSSSSANGGLHQRTVEKGMRIRRLLDSSSDLEEEEDLPACTLAPRGPASQYKRFGFGLSEEDVLADSSESEDGEDEKDQRGGGNVSRLKPDEEVEFDWPSDFSLVGTQVRTRVGTQTRLHKRFDSSETSLLDNPDNRSLCSSRLPSPISPDQDRSTTMTSDALDLSTSGARPHQRPKESDNFYFSQRILDNNRRAYFDRRSRTVPRPESPPRQMTPNLPSSPISDQVSEEKPQKEEDAFSQASHLPSPQLSSCSSLEVDMDQGSQHEEKEEAPEVGGGGGIKPESEPEQAQVLDPTSTELGLPAQPRPSRFEEFDDLIVKLSQDAAEEERSTLSKITQEAKQDGQVQTDDEITGANWFDYADDDKLEGEKKDGARIVNLFDSPSPEVSSPVEMDPEESEDTASAAVPPPFVDPDLDNVQPDPFVDSGNLWEVDSVVGGDPDVDEGDPDAVWSVDEEEGIDEDDPIYEIMDIEEEQVQKVNIEKPDSIDEDEVTSDSPHYLLAGKLLEMTYAGQPLNEESIPSAKVAISFTSPSLKRRLSETDFEGDESEPSKPLTVEIDTNRLLAPLPKRRRIATHVAGFALGIVTGMIGVVASLSAAGAWLDEENQVISTSDSLSSPHLALPPTSNA